MARSVSLRMSVAMLAYTLTLLAKPFSMASITPTCTVLVNLVLALPRLACWAAAAWILIDHLSRVLDSASCDLPVNNHRRSSISGSRHRFDPLPYSPIQQAERFRRYALPICTLRPLVIHRPIGGLASFFWDQTDDLQAWT